MTINTVAPGIAASVKPVAYPQAQQYPDVQQLPSIEVTPVYGNDGGGNAPLQAQVSTVPAGAVLNVALNDVLTSSTNQIGELFTATLTDPINAGEGIVIPAGSEVIGQITYLDGSGRIGKDAAMDIKFTSIKLPNGQKVPIMGKISTVDKTGVLKGGSLKKQLATAVGIETIAAGGGTLAGLGLGSLMGSAGGGTLFGLTAGSLFGLGYVFARKGKDVSVPAGTKFSITLEQPVTVNK